MFVADSQIERMEANIESMQNLYDNMAEHGYDLTRIPFVVQYNKRDLPNAAPIARAAGGAQPGLAGRGAGPAARRRPTRTTRASSWCRQLDGRVDRAGAVLRGGGRQGRRRVRHAQGRQQAGPQDPRLTAGPMWTLPNILTLVRIALTPVIALLPFIEGYWPKVIAFVVFIARRGHRHRRRLPRPQPQPGHRPRQAARSRSPTSCSSSPPSSRSTGSPAPGTTSTTSRSGAASRCGSACCCSAASSR